MSQALFYHLTRRTAAQTLAALLPKSLERGWRVVVRGTDPSRLEALDRELWLHPDEGFLPHGMAGGPHDAAQPILLTTEMQAPNAAACLILVDGAPVEPVEVQTLDRVCILFDGHDANAVAFARGQWKALTDAGLKAQYWSEEAGRWEMKAEG